MAKREREVKAHKRKGYTRLVNGKLQTVSQSKVGAYRRQIEEEKKKNRLLTGATIGSLVLATTVLGVALSKGKVKANTFKQEIPKKTKQLDQVIETTSKKVSTSKASEESKDILSTQLKNLQDEVAVIKSEKDKVIKQYDDLFKKHDELVKSVEGQKITNKELSKTNKELLDSLNKANEQNKQITTGVNRIREDLAEINSRLTQGKYLSDNGEGVVVEVEKALRDITEDISQTEGLRSKLSKQLRDINTKLLDDILPTTPIQLGKVRGKLIEDDIYLSSLLRNTDADTVKSFDTFLSSPTYKKVGFVVNSKSSGDKLDAFFNIGINPDTKIIELSNITNLNTKNTQFTKGLLNKITALSVSAGNPNKVLLRVNNIDDPLYKSVKKNLRSIDTDNKLYEYIPGTDNVLDIKAVSKSIEPNFSLVDNSTDKLIQRYDKLGNVKDNLNNKVEKQIEAYIKLISEKNNIASQSTNLSRSNIVPTQKGIKENLEEIIPQIEADISLIGLKMYKQSPTIFDDLYKQGSQSYERQVREKLLKSSVDIDLLNSYNELSKKYTNYIKIQNELANKGIILSKESIERKRREYQKQILKDWVENNIDNTKLLPISKKKII